MNCNHAYSTVFLYDNFGATFITKYRRHRSDIIWTRQLFHLPVINDYMALLKEEQKMKEEVKRTKIRLRLLTDEFTSYRGKRDRETVKRRAEIREEKKQVNGEISSAYRRGGEATYDAWALKRDFTRNEKITRNANHGQHNQRSKVSKHIADHSIHLLSVIEFMRSSIAGKNRNL